ncbi:hypothetical protein EHQ53_04945 [Leptospira langatensis]|uniref:1-acyl-sn-glycerol-3-phosphate acyltransferase n=1 Tax=Leptospira langatensis TaxID=2484983 RepID=A0ABY2MGQ6_9LEPT|nr:hypothetical protein [Leptospira langatensis]TGL42797.1 hypothetical protein EHQ53_04945 [Leptospira langatensis]
MPFFYLIGLENRGISPLFLFPQAFFVRVIPYIYIQEPKGGPMKTEHRNTINQEKISALAELLADKLIEEIRKRTLERHENFPKEAA